MSDRTKDYISFPSSNNTFTMYVADNDDGLKWGHTGRILQLYLI